MSVPPLYSPSGVTSELDIALGLLLHAVLRVLAVCCVGPRQCWQRTAFAFAKVCPIQAPTITVSGDDVYRDGVSKVLQQPQVG